MNVWNFTGNLGGDAETRFTQSGDAIVGFSVGVKAGYGDKATTTWARCSMFGNRGEAVAQYLTKGQLVGISGEVAMREWNDKEGKKRISARSSEQVVIAVSLSTYICHLCDMMSKDTLAFRFGAVK